MGNSMKFKREDHHYTGIFATYTSIFNVYIPI